MESQRVRGRRTCLPHRPWARGYPIHSAFTNSFTITVTMRWTLPLSHFTEEETEAESS